MTAAPDGQIITFYSQKGGTGRTMALANVAWILASNGYRVLASDWDIEAPGLHRYFHPFLDAAASGATTGVLNLFTDYVADRRTGAEPEADVIRRHASVLPHSVSVDWPFPDDGTLDYMPAGRRDAEYLTHLMGFNWGDFTEFLGGVRFLEALRHDMRSRYDYTLIDSRCGVSDLVALCTMDLPDVVVNCFTLSSQSIAGGAAMARTIRHNARPRDVQVLPVAMRVAEGRADRLTAARELVRVSIPGQPDGSRACLEIPHRQDYAYEEILTVFGDPPGSPDSLLAALERLTGQITAGAVTSFPALDDDLRRRHLTSYVRPLSPVATPLRLWHAPEDRMWADWVRWVLTRSGFEVLAPDAGAGPTPSGTTPRTVALLSSSFLRSTRSRTLWERVAPPRPGSPGQLVPFRIEPITLAPPFSDHGPVDLTSLDESHTAQTVLRSVGLSGEATLRPLESARPRFPGRTPTVWQAPPRNPFFVGRDRHLDQLHAILDVSRRQAAVLPRQGLGACGRTQLAVEYAHRFQAAYDLVWWVRAQSRESTLLSLARLAGRLGLRHGDSVPEAARRTLDELGSGAPYDRWLLVYDNAGGPQSLDGLLPSGAHGHVLVTSRDRRWTGTTDTVEVDAFTREQSIELLRRRVPVLAPNDADRIATAVEDMPLAVTQAASWLAQTPQVEDYLRQLAEQRHALPSTQPGGPVAATTLLALATLRERAPAALRLLMLCSHLAPLPVPLAPLYTDTALRLLRPHDPGVHERLLLGKAVQELSRLGLTEVDQAGHTLRVHRIVQALVLAAVPESEDEKIRHEAHRLLGAAGPRRDRSGGDTDDETSEELWPHLDQTRADECGDDDIREMLIERLGRTVRLGMPERALELGRRLDQGWSRGGVDGEHQVLRLRTHQAAALRSLGAYGEASGLDADTLSRQRELLPPGHAHTLMTAAGLAEDLRALGRVGEALRLAREVSAGFRDSFGEEHPQALSASEAFARSLSLTGEYSAAREKSLAALQRRREVLGNGHPSALVSTLGLGRDLREVGDYAGSVTVLRPALNELRGHSTRGALRATVSLSVSLRRMGELKEAEALASAADREYDSGWDRDDGDRLACGLNLAVLAADVGDLAAARTAISLLQHRFLRLRGPEHPDLAVCDHNLAVCLRSAGEANEALATATRTVRSLGACLGDTHPYTLCARLTLANVLGDLEQFDRAEEVSRSCAATLHDCLGSSHPDSLIADLALAVTLRSLGRIPEATRLRDGAVSLFARRLGAGHPWTKAARNWQRIDRDLEPLLPA
ncbi:FxSxx-COOH system tetratricopeptide repeat protein [Streptomyces bicolor]|uniref:FxSxx-COOH system tetratricopeptide repeat protein n=1 Tax=Streptomyces bicolor TaxID=66874 RepID=UPI0004E2895B|nr:FxSxx-COOH system tetratricopeptide repeat protein [Streptomyces bicolor]